MCVSLTCNRCLRKAMPKPVKPKAESTPGLQFELEKATCQSSLPTWPFSEGLIGKDLAPSESDLGPILNSGQDVPSEF